MRAASIEIPRRLDDLGAGPPSSNHSDLPPPRKGNEGRRGEFEDINGDGLPDLLMTDKAADTLYYVCGREE